MTHRRWILTLCASFGIGLAFPPAPAGADASWYELPSVPPQPLGRDAATGVLDTRRGRIVLTGGAMRWFYHSAMIRHFTDTWAYDPAAFTWQQIEGGATGSANGTQYAAAVYDSLTDRMVRFGGIRVDAYGALAQIDPRTRTLALGDVQPAWVTLQTSAYPGARYGHTMILDPLRRRVLLFGGYKAGTIDYAVDDEVWSLTLDAPMEWTQIVPAGPGPAPRAYHGAIYDPGSDRMIVHGGVDASGARSDTWALSLSGAPAWTPLDAGPDAPPGAAPAFFDAAHARMVVIAGQGVWNCVPWAMHLPNGAWQPLMPTGSPSLPPDLRQNVFPNALHLATLRIVAVGGASPPSQSTDPPLVLHAIELDDPPLVQVPPASMSIALALARPSPNPAATRFSVAVEVPGGPPAVLEVFDLTGRRVRRTDVPVGGHRTLAVSVDALRPGVYLVRLRQGSASRDQRLAIVR